MLADRLGLGGMVRELFSPSILPNKTVGLTGKHRIMKYTIYFVISLSALVALSSCGNRVERFTYVRKYDLHNTQISKYWIFIGYDDRMAYLKRVDYELQDANDHFYHKFKFRNYSETGFCMPTAAFACPAGASPGSRMKLAKDGTFKIDDEKKLHSLELYQLVIPPAAQQGDAPEPASPAR